MQVKFGEYSAARCHANAIAAMLKMTGASENINTEDGIGQLIASGWNDLERILTGGSNK